MPDWYPTLRAARYLKVAPWDLERQPSIWTGRALAAERAETGADAVLQRNAQRSASRRSKKG